MRYIRVKTKNGERYTKLLQLAGYQARWLGPGTASSSFMSGCTDPACCYQHKCVLKPFDWGSIETDASGTTAHRIWINAKCNICGGTGGATGCGGMSGYEGPCHTP